MEIVKNVRFLTKKGMIIREMILFSLLCLGALFFK